MDLNDIGLPGEWERVDVVDLRNKKGDDDPIRRMLGYALRDSDWSEVAEEGEDFAALEPRARGLEGEKHPLTLRGALAWNYRWELLRNRKTGGRALVRLQRDSGKIAGFSAVVMLPPEGELLVQPSDLRALPLANAALAYEMDIQRKAAVIRRAGELREEDIRGLAQKPLGSPNGSRKFYARAAVQFDELEREGSGAPRKMAEINGVSLKTAQRWITTARKMGFLPPGRAGRTPSAEQDSENGLD